MLGKDHIAISIAFVLTFIIPLFFLGNIDFIFPIVLLISVLIGSLLPDVDCEGKPTLFYRFPEIHKTAHFIATKTIIPLFKHLISKKKIKTEYDVKDEHRGIIHSPIGVLLSSFIFALLILIFSLIFGMLNWIIILIIFVGLIIGQMLHLFQDSCTISGINWGFPFNTKTWKNNRKSLDF